MNLGFSSKINITPLKEAVRLASKSFLEYGEFDSRWDSLISNYATWMRELKCLNTSTINLKLKLYQLIIDAFPIVPIRDDKQITAIILSDIPETGSKINIQNREMEIIRREISDRFGIVLTLKDPDGRMISQEFFD